MADVFESAQPRGDVLKGELRDEIFAAKLEDVVNNRADPVYQDPTAFFANTFATGGLRALLTEALGRATGAKPTAAPIIRLETAFGGGKTHNLIALYHLANEARPIGIEQFVDPAVLPASPTQIPTAVGTALEPATGVNHGDVTTHTLWGELAYQAGAYAGDIRQADEDRVAPGTGVLADTFGTEPTIVLIDELARYLAVAEGVRVGSSTLADQTLAFLMALLEQPVRPRTSSSSTP
jgi:predicted AAA+ superfamily ATPase